MRIISFPLFLFISISFLNLSHVIAQDTKSLIGEENEIKDAVENLYIEGLATRNFDLIKKICIREDILMGVRENGDLNVNTLANWSKRFDPDNPPFEKLDYCITKIDVEGTAAQVKILFIVNDKTKVTDFLHLLKVKNEWKVVNIIDY